MNENRDAAIVELVRSGTKQADVARALGLTRERVRQICMRAGLGREERTHFKQGEIDLETVHQRNMAGETILSIAESLEINPSWLNLMVRRAGYEINAHCPRRNRGVRKVWKPEIVAQMWADYQAGMRYHEIAEKYGTYQPQVARLFKEYQFPRVGQGNYIRR